MLPGFRFLVAAIVLSMSLLIFGLGAAALLRAAHEEFAANPSWRTAPEVTFAQPEPTTPVLAALHVELPAAATPQDLAPATAPRTEETAAAPASASTDSTEQIAAQQPEEASLPRPAEPQATTTEIPVVENAPPAEPAPVSAEKSPAAEEVQIASVATSKISTRAPEEPRPPAASERVEVPLPAADLATTKIATLGGPAVSIESPPTAKISAAKPDTAKADQNGKRARAKEANRRRIAAARAKLAAQQAQQQQLLQANPFLQQPLPLPGPQTTRRQRPTQQSLITQQPPLTTAQ